VPKLLRVLLSIFAVLSLGVALAACGDDDDADTEDTTTTEPADEATDEGEGEGEEGNPCLGGATAEGNDGEAPAEGATPVEVGVLESDGEYAFTGGEGLDTQGEYAMTLNNTGQELHMAFITRLADSETRSVEELLALPEEEQDSIESEDLAEAFACPGQTSGAVAVSIDEPGRYVLLCFIPVGSTADAAELPDGPPHAVFGMFREITVS
jgi:hypothetical protein